MKKKVFVYEDYLNMVVLCWQVFCGESFLILVFFFFGEGKFVFRFIWKLGQLVFIMDCVIGLVNNRDVFNEI